jgi:hypothetical protein
MAVKKSTKAKTKAKRYGGLPDETVVKTGGKVNPIFWSGSTAAIVLYYIITAGYGVYFALSHVIAAQPHSGRP